MKAAFKILKSKNASVEEMKELITQLNKKEAQSKEELEQAHQKVIELHKSNLMGGVDKSQLKTNQIQEQEIRNDIEALAEIIREGKGKMLARLQQDRAQRISELEKKRKDLRARNKELEKEQVSAFARYACLIEMIAGTNPLQESTRFESEERQFFRTEVAKNRTTLNPGGEASLKAQRNAIDSEIITLSNQQITEADVERLIDNERERVKG